MTKSLAEFLKISICLCEKSGNNEGGQILIGSPEIVFEKLKLGSLKLNALRIIAVDEADKLVPQEAMKDIFEYIDENIQVVMFSTAMPEDVLMIAKKYTRDPVMISIEQEEFFLGRITHLYLLVDEKESKSETLVQLLLEGFGKEVILFLIIMVSYGFNLNLL